jgi:Xaa-Pro aminopeptidase
MTVASISTAEYTARRERVLKQLRGAAAVVFAGEGSPPLLGKWRPDYNFLYLTGIPAEAGAAVLFDPKADDPKRRIVLILRALDPEMERWDGYRDPISARLKEQTGFQTILRANHLARVLATAARRTGRLACLHPFSAHTAPVSPDLTVFRKVTERIPGVVIEDRTNLLPSLRAVKSRAELSLMRRAIEATVAGYEAACSVIRPGATEAQVQDALEQTYRAHGATGPAYNSIVGSGLSGTVLHYMDNTGALEDGDLLVIDSGAEYDNYTSDVTRTYPVSGKFTREQRDMYEVVLRAQSAAIKAARPGAMMWEVDGAARGVIDRAGYRDAYIHGIGHQLGMEVHDVTPDGPLAPGMVVTIEPGIYLPELKSGIRIEDDILITTAGNRNLTDQIPKAATDVEGALRGARRRPAR